MSAILLLIFYVLCKTGVKFQRKMAFEVSDMRMFLYFCTQKVLLNELSKMKKTMLTLALGAMMLLASCGTHTATGVYTGASLGGMIGSAVGSMSGKANGSAVGTMVGAAGGAAVGGAIGSAMDKKQNSGR